VAEPGSGAQSLGNSCCSMGGRWVGVGGWLEVQDLTPPHKHISCLHCAGQFLPDEALVITCAHHCMHACCALLRRSW
jgi:hypothetical protein